VRYDESIDGFEFTPQVALFDLLNVRLVHGWLVDPADVRVPPKP